MKKIFYLGFLMLVCCCIISENANAQCAAGEIKVSIQVTTDAYGYEGYWELVPSGNECGEATIFEGGNTTQIGCTGAGEQDATTAYGYADNTIITEGHWCVVKDALYDIIYVEDWGDGGFNFTVLIGNEEFPIYAFIGEGEGNTFTFIASPPLDWNLAVTSIVNYPYQNIEPIFIGSTIYSYSANTINSIDVNYSIDGSTAITATVDGLNILPFTQYTLSHPAVWTPTANGTYDIEFWTSNPNGNTDMDVTNDYASKTIIVGDAIPDIINTYFTVEPEFTVISNSSDGINEPTDLDFHPILSNYEVWVVNHGTEGSGGETLTIYDAGTSGQTIVEKQDGNAWHFMSLPTGIAFSQNSNFATSPGVLDANHGGGHFTGPALWSSDMNIYGEPSGGNGSHLDMIHQSPYSMGIEYDKDNAFWVYNGFNNSIDWVDFVEDHGPGNDYHADGKVRRYNELDIDYEDEDIPCHLTLDRATGWLYIVDNGNDRILRMDINSGEVGSSFTPYSEPLAETVYMENVIWEEYLNEGFVIPSGIEVIGNHLIVGDYDNGDIIIYDIAGATPFEAHRISTGSEGLAGIEIGPDGKIWFVNSETNELVRIDFGIPAVLNNNTFGITFSIYPNPANEKLIVTINSPVLENTFIRLSNVLGEVVFQTTGNENKIEIDVSAFESGSYLLSARNNLGLVTKTVIIQN